jgi:sulfotransferase
MSDKIFHFVSGLPRSGSTLLCNLLWQNPRLYASETSGIMDVMWNVRNQWDNLIEFKAVLDKAANQASKLRVLRAVLEAHYAAVDRPVIFDKARSWLAHLEMAEAVLGRKAKVLVPVRDVRDVLASFEKLWRSNAALRQAPQEGQHYFEFQTVEGRCKLWACADQPVGLAYNRVKDALQRGFRDRMHFVRFEELTQRPAETMRGIYEFLGETPFEHDFEHVEQITREDDEVHGLIGLHTIRSKVEPIAPQWPKILGKAADTYAGLDLW